MLRWHKGVPGQTEDVERHQREMGSKTFCGEGEWKEKGERLSEISNQMGCSPWFHLHLALWADKNHTSTHLSLMHWLPGMKGCSAAPTDEGILRHWPKQPGLLLC